MDGLLMPLKVAEAWVMVTIHKLLVAIGMSDGPGPAWVLSIVGLTVAVRVLIMPLFVKQIRSSRGMQAMQPELRALQNKYKGKKDPASQERMREEIAAVIKLQEELGLDVLVHGEAERNDMVQYFAELLDASPPPATAGCSPMVRVAPAPRSCGVTCRVRPP